jgi:hypothetical protein
MELARETGRRLSEANLPESLKGPLLREANVKRAALLQDVAGPLIARQLAQVQGQFADPYDLQPQITALARDLMSVADIDEITRRHIPDVLERKDRLSIALRLWAGYMDTAKVIAGQTRYEANDATTRRRDIQLIEERAAEDPIYEAGVEAAPHFKNRVLGEPIFCDGIPKEAVVMRDWSD